MKPLTKENISELSVTTVRTLSIDSVEYAKHGHLGMPLGAAPMAYTLYRNVLKHNPKNPKWYDRDRFVLSSGHGSILQYTLLHLTGYDVSLSDLKNFRKLGSKTPGHPEVGYTPGVEATTGPLGQGLPMVVGMAIAERHLAAKYNKDDLNIVDHYTYTICGDGDLMEGVGQEAMSLAGHLGLGKLIVLYDSNDICSDGSVTDSNTENVQEKYKAMGWQTILVEDGNNLEKIQQAIELGKKETNKPTLIEVKTVIGYGSPNLSGTAHIHSNPVGEEEAQLIKQQYGWHFKEPFHIPDEVKEDFSQVISNGVDSENKWNELFEQFQQKYPGLATEFIRSMENEIEISELSTEFTEEKVATRSASGTVLNEVASKVPSIIGGSADLASSNKTTLRNNDFMTKEDYRGSNIHFGVREFGMAAIINGIALHGGIKGYCGTFLVFSDYMRSAIRMSAIMKVPVTYVFTHDSIMLGPDGPTHQPIEHLISLRAMPNLNVIRPADANETKAAWLIAANSKKTPTAIILGRHDVPVLDNASLEGVQKGAYLISEGTEEATGIIIATGSEVELAIKAQKILESKNIFVNVVSMPSWELFNQQSQDYKNSVLPSNLDNKLAVEMGSDIGWRDYIGPKGDTITIHTFGDSGNGQELAEKLGFTPENIAHRFIELKERNQ
ncbi:transketolase [Niallia circulans]|uniref:transketolase n=1 Tax=Shouchella clausii TaxID=79880 RepID=UPI000BA564ED|nr:transketolase [Shouchella clausii]MCM3548721.1 transketolase [Shouchella clausii]PAF13384.1 transketolase [Shouchella clausii]SPT81706.1 transketolase [Niallia circulans]